MKQYIKLTSVSATARSKAQQAIDLTKLGIDIFLYIIYHFICLSQSSNDLFRRSSCKNVCNDRLVSLKRFNDFLARIQPFIYQQMTRAVSK